MAQTIESLFWASHAAFHRKLQDGVVSRAVIDEHYEWLLYSTQKFKPSNDASRKLILERLRLEVKGKAIVYDAKLRPLAIRAAKLLDLDEVQTMLIVKRWLKDNEPELMPDQLPENDPVAMNALMLQILKYYNSERILLLKCIQVVMLKAGDTDDGAGASLADLLSRLTRANIEEQLHTRLRENLEAASTAITRRLKAASDATSTNPLSLPAPPPPPPPPPSPPHPPTPSPPAPPPAWAGSPQPTAKCAPSSSPSA